VLVEGYKREPHAKIEVRRLAAGERTPLALADPSIAAIAADHPVSEGTLPVFDLDDVPAIADFIGRATGLA
jgi:molybdopterin-guanine dinucleotide biosynthesis protein B